MAGLNIKQSVSKKKYKYRLKYRKNNGYINKHCKKSCSPNDLNKKMLS